MNTLQVEPLHFTCHATSTGTKMEKVDSCMSTINIGAPLYDSTATNNNGVPDMKTIHQTYVSFHTLFISHFFMLVHQKFSSIFSVVSIFFS